MRKMQERALALGADMTTLLTELVEIESPSDDPAGVARLATRVAAELMPLGIEVQLPPVLGGGPVLLGRHAGKGKPIFVLGHMDTVWPVGTLAARPVRIEGDRFSGPGSYDMKGGLVVAVFALRLLHEAGLLPAITVFFTPLEEVDCEPYRALMEREMSASAACLDFEPAWPGGAVKTSRKGSGSFVLRARGKAAHAGADYRRGANAVLDLAHQVIAATKLTDLERGLTVNAGVVRGGIRANVIPDLAEAELDVRYATQADGRRLEAALRALRPVVDGVTLELEGGLHYPPLERTPDVVRVYEAARAVAEALGQPALQEIATGGASEASFASALGIPTLDGLGADGDGAHALDEHVLLSSIPPRAALAAGLIASLARQLA
jgi:glutamate carboxypeptidase